MSKWRDSTYSTLEKLNVVKVTTSPKLLCRLNKILIFMDLDIGTKVHMFENRKNTTPQKTVKL